MNVPRNCDPDSGAIPARWNHFSDRGVLGGESSRLQRSLEEADMSRTVVDAADLERRVKDMYTQVALEPHARYHFDMGRAMASRLGYTDEELDAAPPASIESFAGVGYYFGLANLRPGERVVDLGSGSGMDSFMAAHKVGANGQVTGIDMTDAQLEKADRLGKEHGFTSVQFRRAFIDETAPRSRCSGAGPCVPAGRDDRDGQLDQDRLHRPDVCARLQVHRASRNAIARAVGR